MDINLKEFIHQPALKRSEQVLLTLYCLGTGPHQVKSIRDAAVAAGLRKIVQWNVSALLSSQSGDVFSTPAGWELSNAGATRAANLCGAGGPTRKVAVQLRSHLSALSHVQVREFVEEAVSCFEAKLYRSAVVLSWVGAVAVLQNVVHEKHLSDFNDEARRRNPKWKDAKTTDDMSRMKEHDFLQVLESISVIGNNVKQELEAALKLRNGCGHPNSLRVAEHRVAAHIESLMLNVFANQT